MHIRVLYFGALKESFPRGEQMMELPAGSTTQTVLDRCRDNAPAAQKLWPSLAIAVNQQYAPRTRELEDGDEVALLPPVSGGSASAPAEISSHVALVREPIDTAAISAALRQPADGAISLFDGIVRNNSRGRQTLYLDYEAYEPMALEMLRSLASEAGARWQVREVAIVHRLGRLEVGETSVFIAVAAAHRAPALDACHWLIDTLKKTVPIWKKEHFVDGAVWADGEPFPERLGGGSTGEKIVP